LLYNKTLTSTLGVTFDLYMTGTNPQHTRFFMLQAEEEERVRLAVYYFSPQRLDVFKDDIYIYPTNAEITGDGNYNLKVKHLLQLGNASVAQGETGQIGAVY